MPLELTDEEKESLRDGGFIEGTAISKLLESYNPGCYEADRGIANNLESLSYALQALQSYNSETNLIVLHVNTLSRRFEEGRNNHYVGLVVNRQNGGPFTVQYIDPMGQRVHSSIMNTINTSLGSENIQEFQQYNGRLQYVNIRVQEGTRYVEGNDHDCGPMLTYLLTRAAHGKALPTTQNKNESREIGKRLRRIFFSDNIRSSDEELALLHNIDRQDMTTLIYVPQGCYAEVTNNTPIEISGLVTSGMGPCCHVIVANKATNHIFLCHADNETDLTDKDHGIIKWIKTACNSQKDYKYIIIHIGEKENESRWDHYEIGQGNTFYEQIKNCLDELEADTGVHIDVHTSDINRNDQYGIFLSRKNNKLDIKIIDGDTSTAVDELERQGYGIETFREPSGEKFFSVERSIHKALSRRKRKDGAEKCPPICVFDSTSGNNFLSIDDLANRYSNYDIEWDRVKRNAKSVSSKSGSESGKDRRRSSTSSNDSEDFSSLSSHISTGTSIVITTNINSQITPITDNNDTASSTKVSLDSLESLNSSLKTVRKAISEDGELPDLQDSMRMTNNNYKAVPNNEWHPSKIRRNIELIRQNVPRNNVRHNQSFLEETGQAPQALYKEKNKYKTNRNFQITPENSLSTLEISNFSSKTVQTSISEGSELPGMQKSVGIANNGKTAMSGEQRARKIRKNLEAVDQEKPRYARHTESSLAKTGHASPAFYKHKKNSKTQPWK